MTLWYNKLGFKTNPFTIKPGMLENELVAYDVSYIHEKIANSELVFIEGRYGSGKTTILKNIINAFRGKYKIIYYSFNEQDKFDIKKLLDGTNSLLDKITGKKVSNVIMLLDEVHTMKKTDAARIIKYYESGIIKSIVFVSHDYGIVTIPEQISAVLNGNVIRTVDLSNSEAIELVRSRIGNTELLSNNVISKLFRLAEKNPRRLLEYCEDVCKYSVEMGDDTVTEFHINEVLAGVIKDQETKLKKKEEPIAQETVVVNVSADNKQETVLERQEQNKINNINEKEELSKDKKFKINKLVGNHKDTLGTITPAAEEKEEVSEYSIYSVEDK